MYLATLESGGTPTASDRLFSLSLIHSATMSREPFLRIPAYYGPAVTFLPRVLLSALNSFRTSGGSGTLRPKSKLNCSQNILRKLRSWSPPSSSSGSGLLKGRFRSCKQTRIRCNGTSAIFIISLKKTDYFAGDLTRTVNNECNGYTRSHYESYTKSGLSIFHHS